MGILLAALLYLQVPVPPRPQAPAAPGLVQGPARDQQQQRPPAVGTGVLSGTVIAENGQAVRGARVSLGGSQIPRTVTTDHSGAFTFEKLPEGRYTISVSKPRYLGGSYGQKRPERSGTPIQLANGQQLRDLRITLFGAGVITGMVTSEDGEPVQNANVRAMRYGMQSGVRRLQMSGSAQTDDRGQYRIFGLSPGDYIIAATSTQNEGGQLSDAMVQALEKAAVAAAASGQPFSFSLNNNQLKLPSGETIDMPAPVSYAPTYYPGATTAATATMVAVRGGEERPAVDITLMKVQTVSISGSVLSPGGALPQGVSIQIQSNDDAGVNVPLPGTSVQPDGRFTLRGVPPGQYVIVARASTTVRTPAPAVRANLPEGAAGPVAGMQVTTLMGRVPVSVAGQPITDLLITLDAGRSVSGRVTFVGAAPDLTKVRMTASLQMMQTASTMGLPSPQAVPVDADGSFKINGMMPGRYILRVGGGANVQLYSSMVGGRDSLDYPFEVEHEDITGALVTMGPAKPFAEVTGLVRDEDGKPVSDYTLVFFSADPLFWQANSRRVTTSRPGTDGRYQMRGMPPGDYLLAAVSDLEPGQQFDPEFLRSLVGASTRMSVAEGAKLTQDLRIR